jgi:transposase
MHRVEGLSARAVARQLGISRNTVLRALASDRPPQYRRAPKGSAVDAVEPAVRELLKQTPTMPVTVIAERIGWERGLTILRERVRELRPAYLPVDPVSRTTYEPGELALCDLWFPAVDIPLGYGQTGRPPVLVIVSGYSRVITARMLPSRQTGDLIDGHWRLLTGWQAVAKTLVWDNEPGIGKGRLTSEFAAFAGLLTIRVHLCRPRDPEAKGLVERANGYLETSFLPGRVFTGPDDFNAQLTAWLQVANRRHHRGIDARPQDRWEADRAAMLHGWLRSRSANSASERAWLHRTPPATAAARQSGGHRMRRSGPTARRGAGWQAAPACSVAVGWGGYISASSSRATRRRNPRARTEADSSPCRHSLTTDRDHARIDASREGSQAGEGAGGRGRGRER